MNKAFIFDMDGTLFQTNLILEPALDATFDVLRTNGLWQGETPIEKYREIMGFLYLLCGKHYVLCML